MGKKNTHTSPHDNIPIFERSGGDRKNPRSALLEGDQEFRTFAETTPFAVMLYRDDRWIFINKAAEDITGYSESELLSQNFWDLVHPDYRETIRDRGRDRMNGKTVQNRYEVKIITKDGNEKWIWVTGASLMTEGRRAGVISATDITELKRKDEALARSMERLEIISNTASRLLFANDPQKMIDDLCKRVMAHLDCHVFFNYLVNDDLGCLQLNAYSGIPRDIAQKITFLQYGEAVCGYAAQTGCRIVADNIPTVPDPRADLVRSFGITAYVCHPLLDREKVMGTLSFGTRSRLEFTEDELLLMKTIADQVATAIERMKLLTSIRAQAENLDVRVRERTRQLKQQADLLDLSNDAIIVADLEGRIIFWSTGAENTYGFRKQEVIGKYVYRLLRTRSKTPLEKILETVKKEGRWEGEIVHACKNGTWITTHSRWALRTDDIGNPLEIMEVNRDISLRIQAEESLRAAYSYNRSLFQASIDPLMTINPRGLISDANAATEHITGLPRDRLIGTDFSQYFSNPGKARQGYELAFKKGTVRDFELEITHSDGHLTPVLYNASVYKNDAGDVLGVFAAARDITERRMLEEELRQAHKMKAIGTLAGGIAHDFNNILAAIIGFSEILHEDLEKVGMKPDYIEKVLKAATRGKDLVKQILAFSRKTTYSRSALPITSILEETFGLLRVSLPSTIAIRLDLRTLGAMVIASAVEIQQVVVNLATNAAFAMRDTGGTLVIALDEIELKRNSPLFKHSVKPGTYIQLTVSDTGKGMTRDIMDRVFDPFFTTKGIGEGTGMGLAVVYGIVESLGGTVSVRSKPGKGSTFTMLFPKAPAIEACNDGGPAAVPRGSERVLFIDDEELLVEWGQAFLRRLGYTVDTAQNGTKALEMFKEGPHAFDLVITDQTMPDMMGSRLAVELLKMRPDIPIILCTGHSDLMTPDKAKEAGIRKYLKKPLSGQDLAQAVRETLESAKV